MQVTTTITKKEANIWRDKLASSCLVTVGCQVSGTVQQSLLYCRALWKELHTLMIPALNQKGSQSSQGLRGNRVSNAKIIWWPVSPCPGQVNCYRCV